MIIFKLTKTIGIIFLFLFPSLFVASQELKSHQSTNASKIEKIGSSEHFEFYTNIAEQEDFYTDYIDTLEYKYKMYKSIWERPSSNTIFPAVDKIKVIYEQRSDIPNFDLTSNNWDCGSFDFQNGEIFISPLDNEEKIGYYGTLGKLMCNELAQMAVHGWADNDLSYWFSEGFGLYEMGYRPNRQQLLDKLSELGTEEPPIASLENIADLPIAGKKDLMVSFFQSKNIIHCYFYGYWGNSTYNWWQLLKHYYIKEVDRIKLIYSTVHFDFYGAEKEIPYVEAMAVNMENQFDLQVSRFGQIMQHRISICIYDSVVGKEINNRSDFQGLACGADKINTSHLDIDDYGLLNHEFMHVWVNMLSPFSFDFINYPGQFLNEGLAESTDAFMTDEEMPWHNYKIVGLFYHYQRKYNREPTWLEIVDNAEVNKEDGFWVDAYALGEMYWRYMHDKYPVDFWIKVKLFLQRGRDWTVFGGKSTEVEGGEFIQFMKELAFVGPPLETTPLPFFEDFRSSFNGWSLLRYGVGDLWENDDNTGYDDTLCAFIADAYWLEEKDVDSWLVSPPLDCGGEDNIDVSFMYKQYGQGIKPEVYYAGNFTGAVDPVDWVLVENISWDAQEGEWSKINFTIKNAPERLNIAIRFLSEEGNYASYFIDNFEVTELLPLETLNATAINHNSSTLNASARSDFFTTVTQHGFYWSQTNSSPTASDNVEIVDGTSEEYTFELTGLSPETTYYFRAFATNSQGTTLGEVKQFTTLFIEELPFTDDFEEQIIDDATFTKWTTQNLEGWQYWHVITGQGVNGSQCMRFENNDADQNDWLVTRAIDCSGMNQLKINFDVLYNGNGVKPQLFYKSLNKNENSTTGWVELNYSLGAEENKWYSINEITINNPGDVIYFAFNSIQKANQGIYFLLDNFNIAGVTTNSETTHLAETNFKIYPNPLTKESIISFTNTTSGKVNLSIYDIRGNKIMTLLDKMISVGSYAISLSKLPLTSGIYFCTLSSENGSSTIKLIAK